MLDRHKTSVPTAQQQKQPVAALKVFCCVVTSSWPNTHKASLNECTTNYSAMNSPFPGQRPKESLFSTLTSLWIAPQPQRRSKNKTFSQFFSRCNILQKWARSVRAHCCKSCFDARHAMPLSRWSMKNLQNEEKII